MAYEDLVAQMAVNVGVWKNLAEGPIASRQADIVSAGST